MAHTENLLKNLNSNKNIMCGLAGFLWTSKETVIEINRKLKSMTDVIKHRGPDDEGFWIDEKDRVAFGHRRLSILDLSAAGHQPMHSLSKRFTVVFNGEIYNHPELRDKLESESKKKIYWQGHSDTETLLYCFDFWGVDLTLKNISGMFAMALYDSSTQSMYLVRDRMGEKPLYYGWNSNKFIFASELKSIKAFDGVSTEVDREALALYLKYDYVPSPFSIYKGFKKLPQGSYLKLDRKDNEWVKDSEVIIKYWSMKNIAKSGKADQFIHSSEQDVIDKLDLLLSKSIKEQMISDVPLGAFLSGGIDSSLIVALMQKQSNRKIKTFTIGFDEKNYNEAEYAKSVARHLGTDHTELYISPEQAIDVISQIPYIYDEPFADSSQIPTFLVSKMAKQHVTVSLSGDGGDELFGGYNRYFMANKLWKKIHRVPLSIRKIITLLISLISPQNWDYLINLIFKFLPKKYRVAHPGDKIYKLSKILTSKNMFDVYDKLVSHWNDPNKVVINSTKINNPAPKATELLTPEEEMMLKDSTSYLPDDILAKVDRASMSVSLEARAPFLDRDVVQFAWTLPFNMKIRNSKGKWILRKVLNKYVPNELIDRPKMGFGVPIDEWLRGPLQQWAENLLSEKRLKDDGYFNVDLVRKKWLEHLSGSQNWQYHLWSILMFQIWLDNELK